MKRLRILIITIITSIMASAGNTLYITANGETITATLESNTSVDELKKLLPLTIRMSDYGGWEKVGDLPNSITREDRQMTARAGDIMLYQGRSIVIFYGENSWAYTPIGKIDNATASQIKEFLKGNSVDVTLSLKSEASSEILEADKDETIVVYDINGKKIESAGSPASELPKGFYIINGKKTLIN